MHIGESSLYRFTNNTWMFYQARDSYYTGELEDISIFKGMKNGKIVYKVVAVFYEGRKKTEVRFDVSFSGIILSTRCSCRREKDEGCAHLIAAVQAINHLNPEYFPYRINYQDYLEELKRQRELELLNQKMKESSNSIFNMVEGFEKDSILMLTADDSKSIHLYIDEDRMYNYGDFVTMGLKIGTDKMYRVKDMRELVRKFNENEMYPLGKSQTIELNRKRLDENSAKILDFLSMYVNAQDWRRNANIWGAQIDTFFDLIDTLPRTMHIFYTLEHSMILPLQIQEGKDYYVVRCGQMEFDSYYMGKKYLYRREGNMIHRYKMDPQGFLLSLLEKIDNENQVYIEKDKIQAFYLKCIRPYEEYISIDSSVDFSSFEIDIQNITLYSDLQDTQVRIWGSYVQDGIEKKLFDDCDAKEIKNIEYIVSHYANSIKENIATFKSRGVQLQAFLDKGLPLLMEQAKVFVSEDLIKLKERKKVNLSVGVQLRNNLLEMNIDTDDVSKEELTHILNAYRRKKKFYRLKNGDMIDLDQDSIKDLDTLASQMNLSTKDLQKDVISKPAYQMMHLEEMDELTFRKDESIQQYVQNLENLSKNTITIPDKYNDLLREYQKEGIKWLYHLNKMELNGILADDMGLGKTLQVLVFLESFMNKKKRSLVVCPSSLMYNWDSEIKKFDIELDAICVTGAQSERIDCIKEDHALYITTYDYLKRDVEWYKKYKYDYIILDEAQYIKNPKTQNAQSIKSLKADHKLALTGTPIENSLTELWSIFDFLLPGYLYSLPYFVKNYEKPIRLEGEETRTEQLKRLVEPFLLRRTKQEVLTDLPDKQEREMWLSFNKEEKNLYLANLAKVNETLQEQLKLEHMDSILILSLMTRLRQVCCEPRLLYENIETVSTKMEMCIDLIETLKENNQKVLLFSSFTSVFDLMIEEFKKKDIKYHILTGSTQKQQRQKEVEAFQNDDSDVFLISLKAGGTGLNLTAAQAVIHFDPWWNVSAQNQATDRAYRIGQTKNVLVYQLLMKNTIEEKIFEMQSHKKQMSDVFVENSKGGISTLTKEELKDLFTYEI